MADRLTRRYLGGMTSVEIYVLIILLAVVVVCCVVIWGLSMILRRRRMVEFHKGPGNPDAPAPTTAWRRFTGALGAAYARPEWLRIPEAKRLHTADQIYYGYGSSLTPFAVVNVLRIDWGVRNSQQAHERLTEAQKVIAENAAAVVLQRGLPGGEPAFRDRLARSGAPEDAVEAFLTRARDARDSRDTEAHPGQEVVVDIEGLAFDIARVANLVRWSGFVRYVEAEQGYDYLDGIGVAAAAVFSDWDDFADTYLGGLSSRFKGGSKQYSRAVEWLRSDPDSPWARQPWIVAGSGSS